MKYPSIIKGFPHFIHGADYNPDQWMDEKIWEEDFRIAKAVGMNSFSVGIFSWTALEPEEGKYNFEWLDKIMDKMAENGMKAILATPSGAKPAWMSQKYPEILRVNDHGIKLLKGERHNHCLTSPVYRQKVREMNEMLAERYKDHPALGAWHISNEYGGECFCPLCAAAFRKWLENKYKTLDALNHAYWTAFWSHTYDSWDEIDPPMPIGEMNVHALVLDWKRFTTEQHTSFYMNEVEPLHRITPDVPCTANLMGPYQMINYNRLADELDFTSWDNYPMWTGRTDEDTVIAADAAFKHDLMRGLKRRPFFLMESSPSATNWRPYARLHRPGVHLLQSVQAVAHGADSVQYFQMRKSRGGSEKLHGAVIDHVGHENTRVTREIAEVGALLKKLDCIIGTDTPSRAAIIYDWENSWAIELSKGFNNVDKKYLETVEQHYNALRSLGVPVDVIDETRDLDKYDLVVAPMLYMLRAGMPEKIKAFTKRGGRFIATFMTGYADENDLCFLGGWPGPIRDVLGIWNEEIDVLDKGENSFDCGGKRYILRDYAELIHPEGAKVLAVYNEDFYAGMPAVTVNKYGGGKAYYIACRAEDAFIKDFYRGVCAECGIATIEVPDGAEVQVRTDGQYDYLFCMNFAAEPKTVPAEGEDLLTGEKVCGPELPAHGFKILKKAKG